MPNPYAVVGKKSHSPFKFHLRDIFFLFSDSPFLFLLLYQ